MHVNFERDNLAQLYNSEGKRYVILVVITVISSLLVYLPFIAEDDMQFVYRYWDGPNYALLAKDLYHIAPNHPLNAYTTPEYFAAHLPIYPLSIKLLSFIGFFNAMLVTTILYTALATIIFYKLLRETQVVSSPLWSAVLSLFIPARYLIYHSVGATEAPFIFFSLWSLLHFHRGNYLLSFAIAGIAGITRITGILFGLVYFLALITMRKWKTVLYLPIIGIPLLALFAYYHFHFGDFFAYFNTNYSDSNKLIHLNPVLIFKLYAENGNTHSAELYLILYAIYGLGTALLWQKNKVLFFFCVVHFTFSLFIFHQDVSRYLIPLAPLALVVAYDSILSKPAAKIMFVPLVFLAYIYSWGLIPKNVVDVTSYNKLKHYLANHKKTEALIVEPHNLSVVSCSFNYCESSLRNRKSGEYLTLTRGINILIHQSNHRLSLAETLDPCASNDVFLKTERLKQRIDKRAEGSSVYIVVHDTAICEQKRGLLNAWLAELPTPQLKTINFREGYIAHIEANDYIIETRSASQKRLTYSPK